MSIKFNKNVPIVVGLPNQLYIGAKKTQLTEWGFYKGDYSIGISIDKKLNLC